jgi:hypothetical protein
MMAGVFTNRGPSEDDARRPSIPDIRRKADEIINDLRGDPGDTGQGHLDAIGTMDGLDVGWKILDSEEDVLLVVCPDCVRPDDDLVE